MRINLQPAYLLHARPYRDTSALLELFTFEHGKLNAIARGARTARSPLRTALQPFAPLLVSWYGNKELMTLTAVEGVPQGMMQLNAKALLSACYLNELLVKTLQPFDAHPALYDAYHAALKQLAEAAIIEIPLRLFEKKLLAELGYALQLSHDTLTHEPINAEHYYHFDPRSGPTRCLPTRSPTATTPFLGKSLLALAQEDFVDPEVRQEAKRLMRQAINVLLGGQPLKSRELFS